MGRHVALFTNGYPYVDAAIRAADLARRHGATLSRTVGQPLSLKRDQFVRWFLQTDASHALFLDGDIVPPEDALDRLLAAGALIVTATYLQIVDGRFCSNVQTASDDTWSATVGTDRFEVRRCLLGCVLVSREALAKISPPWFLSTKTATRFVNDDEWFCAAAARANLPIVCDGSVVCASFRQGTDLRVLQPKAESRKPIAESRKPKADSRELIAESREPTAESREPIAESRASILVGVPTRGYAYAPSLLRASELARRFGREVMLEMTPPMEYGRTRLASRFLESDAEYLLTIDDDVVAPEGAVDRLLALGVPVATAAYPIVADGRVVFGVKAPDSDEWMNDLPNTVFPVRHTGLGFTLIHRDVFTKIRTPWFQFGAGPDGRVVGEDTWFSNGVTKAGLQILCDGSLRCSHFKDGLDLLRFTAASE